MISVNKSFWKLLSNKDVCKIFYTINLQYIKGTVTIFIASSTAQIYQTFNGKLDLIQAFYRLALTQSIMLIEDFLVSAVVSHHISVFLKEI